MAEATLEKSDSTIERVKSAVTPLVRNVKVIKKDGTQEDYHIEKIVVAVNKSASRVLIKLTEENFIEICNFVANKINDMGTDTITMLEMHSLVECALQHIDPQVALSYRNYRNYKQDFVGMLDKVFQESQRIMYLGDKSNANADSSLVTTKRSLMFGELSNELYKKFFLNKEELTALKDGYIYIHDLSSRLLTSNCCLADIATILRGGFELANIWYNEPKSLEVAFGVLSDITLSASGCQYGGFSIGEIDKVLEPYAEMSLKEFTDRYISLGVPEDKAKEQAWKDLERTAEQGVQQLEYKFNTLSSARGDFSFITVSFGLGKSEICKMIAKKFMEVRAKGEGKPNNRKPVLFPKLIFLYDENLHGVGKELEDVFNAAVECNKKSMYPDYVSLSGPNYVSQMYQEYGTPITPMGCVKGGHVLGLNINNTHYIQGFERTWNQLAEKFPVLNQPAGEHHKYMDVSQEDIKVWDTKLQKYVKVNTFIRNMQNKWVTVKLSNGRLVQVTDNHPFETENRGVILAKDLTLGDKIQANYGAPEMAETIEIANSLAWLYGAMLCDGCYQNYSVFASFGKDEQDVINYFSKAIEENYGIHTDIKLQERGKKGNYYDIRIKSNDVKPLKELISEYTQLFGGVQKINRHIPNEVWSYTRQAKLSFLAGMFDADGYIHKKYHYASLGSTNQELAYEQMYLIQSLGMPCKIRLNNFQGHEHPNKVRVVVEFCPSAEFINYVVSQKKLHNYVPNKQFNISLNIVEVTELKAFEGTDYAYDISTESEHFEVNGLYSHNCRSFLSPWYEKGGLHKADENDKPIFVGRGNLGVISLNMPMIYMKAKEEGKDFYTVLDYYLELIRKLHLRTKEYLGQMKASCNPLMYMEGGFLGGHLKADDCIAPVLESFTTSFGVTALNELNLLHNGKSIAEDGEFPLEVMRHMNMMVDKFKEEDGVLHSIYYTPAESLCHTQVKQFRKMYGTIEGVSDKEYMTNGFHCHVSEDIDQITKQDLEGRFLDTGKGGQIYFNRFDCAYNTDSFKVLIRRAMEKGFYFGTNLRLSYCEDCGYEGIDLKECPHCGSTSISVISRVCGYLGWEKVKGDTRYNKGKFAETLDRKSY